MVQKKDSKSAKEFKGKRGNPKDRKDFKDKKSKDKRDETTTKSNTRFVNDPAYYKLNPGLASTAASISFGNPACQSVDFGPCVTGGGTAATTTTVTFDGFMRLEMVPTIGTNGLATDPVTVAAKSIYSWVRHANSGHANYDSPDLMLYLLAMREVYGFVGWITRISAMINKYQVNNRGVPKAFFYLAGINYDDILAHQPDLRFYINTFAKKANALSVPKNLPMYSKAFNMYANIFKEGKSGKDQMYFYDPAGWLLFNPTKYTTGGCLEYKRIRDLVPGFQLSNPLTFANIVAIGDAILNPLLADEDIGIMSGDIRKAFGENLYLLGDIPTDVLLEFVQDAYELQIIHNISLGQINSSYCADSNATLTLLGDVMQDANGVILQSFAASASGNGILYLTSQLCDIDSDVPTEDEIIESALYKVFPTDKAASSAYAGIIAIDAGQAITSTYVLDTFGDYVCSKVSMSHGTNSNGVNQWTVDEVKFEWAPLRVSLNAGPNFVSAYGQLHNYTMVHKDVVNRIHLNNVLSLFAIPAVEHLR